MKVFFKLNKMLIMAFAFFAIMIFGADVVNAASAPNTLTTGSSSYVGQYIGGTYFENKTISSGGYAYCLNIHKNTTANVAITRTRKMDNGFAYIIKNGYPYKSFTGDGNKDYYITQMAVWLYQDETGQNESGYSRNLSANFRTNFADNSMAKQVISLVDVALKERNKTLSCKGAALSSKVEDNKLYKSKSEKYYVSKTVTVTSAASYTVAFDSAPKGTFAANSKGEKKSSFSKGETFNVYVPVENVSVGTTKFSAKISSNYSAKCTSSVVYEYRPSNSNVQSVIPAFLYDSDEETYKEDTSVNFNVTVEEEEESEIKVIKIDTSTGKGLAGAVIELQDENGKVIDSWTSDGNYHTISNVENGTYYVVEKSAPEGYVLNTTKYKVVITDTKRDATIKLYNAKERIVNIVKVDKDTGELIAGAVLVVRDSEGNVVVEFTTSTEPYVLTDLKDGTYTVEEKSAPEGYVKSDEIITITVDDEHVLQTITFTNIKEDTWVPDTASDSSIIVMIIGALVVGSGIGFVVYNSRKQKLNK